jgi:peptide/nickel transport system permease protein
LALGAAHRRALHTAVRPDPAGGARLDDRRPVVGLREDRPFKDRAVIFVHALRNAMLPVITVIGDQAAGLLNGAVVVETIFGFPGVGKLMIDSILQRDFTVVLASIMITAIAIFIMNLLIDLAYAALDPRIRMTR